MVWMILEKITRIFLILFLGLLCYRKKILDDATIGKLSNFLLMIVNPLVIFVSYQTDFDPLMLKNLLITMGVSAAAFVVQIVLIHLIVPKKGNLNWDIERLSAIYSNCGFIGIPLVNSLYGREGVFYLTAYLTVFYLFFWTHGVIIMAGKTDVRSTVKNLLSPAITGVILGLICFLARIRLPETIVGAMDSVGSMITPLAMLVAGATLGQSNIRECFGKPRTYWIVALKLLLVPLAALLLVLPLKLPAIVVMVVLVASACPVGACCTMFALKYKNDGRYASQLFVTSTLLCAATIPLLVLLSEALGLI